MKKNNILKILLVAVCLGAVTVFAMYQAGVDLPFIQAYKNNFKRNVMGITKMLNIELPIEMQLYLDDTSAPTPKPTMIPAEAAAELENALGYPAEELEGDGAPLTTKKPVQAVNSTDPLPIAFTSAKNARFAIHKGNIICVNETQYSSYSKSGELIFKEAVQMQSPSLVIKGDYVLINETGDKKISLYKGSKNLFTVKTEGNIISADVSEKGDVVAVTEKEYYKGQVVVYNKKGKLIFAWDSGSYDILDVAISADRQVAVAMLNTDSGADSFITCLGVDGETKYRTDTVSDSIIYDIEYDGELLNAFADNKCLGVSKSGKITWNYDFGGKRLYHYRFRNGEKMLVFDDESTGSVVPLTSGGKAYSPIKTESMPDTVDIKSKHIAYNSGRDIFITDYKGKRVLKASCDSDVKQLHIIDSKHVLAVYSSSIQLKKLSKPKESENTVIMASEAPETN